MTNNFGGVSRVCLHACKGPVPSLTGGHACRRSSRDREAQAALEAKLMEKLARADIIAEQRSSIAGELQRMRKDIAQQEAWVKVPAAPHAQALCTQGIQSIAGACQRSCRVCARTLHSRLPRLRCCPQMPSRLSSPLATLAVQHSQIEAASGVQLTTWAPV